MLSPQLLAFLKNIRPAELDQLWNEAGETTGRRQKTMDHAIALDLDQIYDDNIDSFRILLQDEERLRSMVEALTLYSLKLGQQAEFMEHQIGPCTILCPDCFGCNTPIDAGCCGPTRLLPRLTLRDTNPDDRIVMDWLHKCTVLLVFCSSLGTMDLRLKQKGILTEDQAEAFNVDKMVKLIAPDLPVGVNPIEHMVQQMTQIGDHKATPFPALLGLLDNCQAVHPKAAHSAIGLFSVILSRRPASALATLDETVLVPTISKFIHQSVFNMISKSQCIVEQSIGTIALLNALPAVYYLLNIKNAPELLVTHSLPFSLTSILCELARNSTDEEYDVPFDYDTFPELHAMFCAVEPIFALCEKSLRLYKERPNAFAMACLVEILARWYIKGIPIFRDVSSNGATIADTFEEHRSDFEELAERTADLRPTLSLANSIAQRSRPQLGKEDDSFLRKALRLAGERCELEGCRAKVARDGTELLRCTGGCKGIAVYCCREHQKLDWQHHRLFCKRATT